MKRPGRSQVEPQLSELSNVTGGSLLVGAALVGLTVATGAVVYQVGRLGYAVTDAAIDRVVPE